MLFSNFFIIFIIIIYNIYIFKKEDWKTVLKRNEIENFHNIEDSKLLEKTYKFVKKPVIYTNYKLSAEHKFGFELSKHIDYDIKISSFTKNIEILREYNNNYINNNEYHNDIYMCLEQDYYRYLEKDYFSGKDVNYICSLYNLELYLVTSDKVNIKKINDIKVYPQYRELVNNSLPFPLIIGIPNDSEFIDLNGEIFFKNILAIDESDDNYKFDYDTTQNLYSKLKKDKVHIVFNISSYKNPYLLEYLRNKKPNFIGTDTINTTLLKNIYTGNYNTELNIAKYNLKKDSKISNFIINIDNLEKKKTISFRVCLLCHSSAQKHIIFNVLKKIYGNIDNLRYNLNQYLYSNNNNFLENPLDPYHMFYLMDYNNSEYHQGAKEFYKKIKLIQNKEELDEDNLYVRKTDLYNKEEFSKLFI